MNSANDRSESAPLLEARAAANARGSFDLGAWIDEHAGIRPASRVFDLGAGTGRHLARYASRVGPEGLYVAMDVSAPSLEVLRDRASRSGIVVRTVFDDMDRLAEAAFDPSLAGFSHILAVYSLYYSRDLRTLLRGLAARLSMDGRLFIIGPAAGNNREWYDLLSRGGFTLPPSVEGVSEGFMDRQVPAAAAPALRLKSSATRTNEVRFGTVQELEDYWQSNTYYAPSCSGVTRAIREHMERRGSFVITKRIALLELVRSQR